MNYTETDEQQALRAAVAELGREYGYAYYTRQARQGGRLTELWQEAGKLGFLGVNLPAEYGGGGAGLYELAIVLEELATAGCGLLMMVVSPAICGTIIARYGTQEQQRTWLPLLASGAAILAFGITEPDAGSNSHRLTTVARRRRCTTRATTRPRVRPPIWPSTLPRRRVCGPSTRPSRHWAAAR